MESNHSPIGDDCGPVTFCTTPSCIHFSLEKGLNLQQHSISFLKLLIGVVMANFLFPLLVFHMTKDIANPNMISQLLTINSDSEI